MFKTKRRIMHISKDVKNETVYPYLRMRKKIREIDFITSAQNGSGKNRIYRTP